MKSLKNIYTVVAFFLLFSVQSFGQETMIKISAKESVEETVKKLTAILDSKGMNIFSVIDHKKGAESVSMELLPTSVIIFGNPSVGTKLMNCDQNVGIDLPMKYLVWEDKAGKTWVGYWKPTLLAKKYNLDNCKPVLAKMDEALSKFASLATQ